MIPLILFLMSYTRKKFPILPRREIEETEAELIGQRALPKLWQSVH
jgi:hypothetical protein